MLRASQLGKHCLACTLQLLPAVHPGHSHSFELFHLLPVPALATLDAQEPSYCPFVPISLFPRLLPGSLDIPTEVCALTLRKPRVISRNSWMEVPLVGLSNSTSSRLGAASGQALEFSASSMPHLMVTSLSCQSPLYT